MDPKAKWLATVGYSVWDLMEILKYLELRSSARNNKWFQTDFICGNFERFEYFIQTVENQHKHVSSLEKHNLSSVFF